MPVRTRTSFVADIDDDGETNWAAAAAAAAMAQESASTTMNDDFPAQEEEEEWVNTGVDDEDEEPVTRFEKIETRRRPTWILKVVIPESATNGYGDGNVNGDSLGSANIFIDSGMTAEQLGRCIIQAVPSTSSDYSQDYNNAGRNNHRGSLVGLFGKDDRVFYSLKFILAMDPADGARRTFCVSKPVRRNVATMNGVDDSYLSSIFSYITMGNLFLATVVLFLSIFVAPIVVDRFDSWNHLIYSLLRMVPQDLPSMWRLLSFILDWPAREVYRYGPSIVGWEGRELIDICTQMNRRYYFVGLGSGGGGHDYEDREYWRHNPEACETIYRMKEEGFARMCRPLWYLSVLVASFMAIQRFIAVFFAKEPGPQLNRTDRAVLNTYKAVQMLVHEHRRLDDRQHQQQNAGRR